MEVVPIPKKTYGSFFCGDAYIILNVSCLILYQMLF